MAKSFLTIEHVDKSFTRGAVTNEVLKNISLEVNEGEFI